MIIELTIIIVTAVLFFYFAAIGRATRRMD